MCRIIEACGKAGVSAMKCGDLVVHFVAGKPEVTVVEPAPQHADGPMSEQPVLVPMKPPTVSESIDEMSELMIENPAEWEARLVKGDMGDAGDQS